ncbi:hypothetical protein OS493_029816 [Desmophyllum pertusum]|uniref:SH3 domain-containing protein n=1 Tax=Desmophyllum pertusum TaxID=174260 RepID=A0A9W9YJU4_9CNID|nr:hypothetical protein OS493_029816 [Desmophyllum pertusum]
MASKTRTYGRGILRFTSLEPCRRPGQTNNGGPNNLNGVHEEPVDNSRVQNGGDQTHVQITTDTGTAEKVPTQKGDKPVKLLAKYNYKANPTKPGGFDELTVTQGEKLELCNAHPSNPHWWEARNENGDVGFVPSSYMMVLEDKISALPWLADQIQEVKQEEEERPVGKFGVGAPAFKPYVSAYGNNTSSNNSSENYYCDICDKKLNGPIPYRVHLDSKAHKEEVSVKEEFNR